MGKKKVSKPAVKDVPTKKRLQPVEVEEPLTANKRLQLAAEDTPTAAKHPQPLKTVPAESSDDDEDMATEEETDSSSDENQPKESFKTPPAKTSPTPPAPASVIPTTKEKQSSDSDSGSESDSESESESETKEKVRVSNEAQPPTKKTKQVVASTDVQPKTEERKEYFQRKWSEDDEVVLLQGMIDYKSDTGKSPYDDKQGFYEIIKNKICFEVQRKQVISKISVLKKKYQGKRSKGVDEKSFANAHEQKCFQLSKVIWDSTKQEDSFKPNDEQSERDWFFKSFLVGSITNYGMDEDVVKQKWSMVSMTTKKKLVEKWKALQAKQFECVLQKTALLHEATSVIAETN